MKNKNIKELVAFFGITLSSVFLIFWGPLVLFKIPGASFSGPSGPPWAIALFILGGFTPSITAIILRWKQKTLREMWKRLNPLNLSLKWYLIILGTIVLGTLGQLLIFQVMGQRFPIHLFLEKLPLLLPLLILGPLSEELGWRGYALERLQKKWNALTSSLILGLIWSIWHLPLFFIVGTNQYANNLSFFAFLLGTTTTSILYTWAYNNTKGSIWGAVLLHWLYTFSMDTIVTGMKISPIAFQWLQCLPYLIICTVVVFVFGADKLRKK